MVDLVELINSKTSDPQHEGLVLDFIGWENSYYLSLKTDIVFRNIFQVSGAEHEKVDLKLLKKKLLKNKAGFLVINKEYPKLNQHLTQLNDSLVLIEKADLQLQLNEIYIDDKMNVYQYKVSN